MQKCLQFLFFEHLSAAFLLTDVVIRALVTENVLFRIYPIASWQKAEDESSAVPSNQNKNNNPNTHVTTRRCTKKWDSEG